MNARQHGQTSGQTLALFAVIAPGILALMALGLDSAQLFLERREAQGAADLAALAGVRSLPDSPSSALDDARMVGAAHGYQTSQIVPVTPYGGDASRIEVTVNTSVNTFFMSILGIFAAGDFSTVNVSARAVAQAAWDSAYEGSGGFAIFALESCPSVEKAVDISGSTSLFIGKVHSNADIHVSGSNITVTGATTSTCGNPAFHDGGGGNTFNPLPALGLPQSDPIGKAYDDYTCTFTAPSSGDWDLANDGFWWVGGSKSSKTLRSGTYCAPGASAFIKLGDSQIVIEDITSGSGGVTFVTEGRIDISGSDFDLHPREFGVLFHAESSDNPALKVAGSGGSWQGAMYAPNGTAEVSGQNDINISGGIVGKRVKLNASDADIDGSHGGDSSDPPVQVVGLVE